jgi:8-oxo-dGTP diphosphatase
MVKVGFDVIGVGVGAMIFNERGEVFLSQRGPKAKNERGTWEFPGGGVEFGEKLVDAIQREILEEYGMVIEIDSLLGVDDHILPDEGQHWVSPTYIAHHVSGEPRIMEPEKCAAIGWFTLDNLPAPLSVITQMDVQTYRAHFSS